MGKLLSALLRILLIAVLAVLTLGFGVIGLCSAFGGRGGEPLIALLLLGAAIAFGLGIIRLVRSIWRLFREPQA